MFTQNATEQLRDADKAQQAFYRTFVRTDNTSNYPGKRPLLRVARQVSVRY
jgi:hypothetical protein